jgi:probable HAF family extracellular repeat protein
MPCSTAIGINESGVIVGSYQGYRGPYGAYIWNDGVITDLGELDVENPAYGWTRAFAINDHEEVVGDSNSHAFLWREGVITDLNEQIPPALGWTLRNARDINNSGYIVGEGSVNGIDASFLLRPTDIRIVSGSVGWKTHLSPWSGWNDRDFASEWFWYPARSPYPNPQSPTDLIPGTKAQHMWLDPKGSSSGTTGISPAYFRYKFFYHFVNPDLTPSAIAKISVDDDYEFFVNGQLVFVNNDNGNATQVDTVDFSEYVLEGENVLAIKATDIGGYERVLFDAEIKMSHLLRGDLNGDGCIDLSDSYLMLAQARKGGSQDARYDLNKDGSVNIADVRYLTARFTNARGTSCN